MGKINFRILDILSKKDFAILTQNGKKILRKVENINIKPYETGSNTTLWTNVGGDGCSAGRPARGLR